MSFQVAAPVRQNMADGEEPFSAPKQPGHERRALALGASERARQAATDGSSQIRPRNDQLPTDRIKKKKANSTPSFLLRRIFLHRVNKRLHRRLAPRILVRDAQ